MSWNNSPIFDVIVGICSIVGAISAFKGGIKRLFTWNASRRLKSFKNEREFLQRVKASDRDLYVFLFSSLIQIAVLAGILLYLRSTLISTGWGKGVVAADWLFGLIIFFFSLYRLGQINRLKNYDKTMSYLNQQIEKLEPKTKE